MKLKNQHCLGVISILTLMLVLMSIMGLTAYAETEYVDVSTFEELTTAVSNGKNIKLTKDIEVTSEITVNKSIIIIDGNGKKLTGNGNNRAFSVKGDLVLKNITLSGFQASSGGAIENYRRLVLDNCKVLNNSATGNGGAIHNNYILTAIDTIFEGNKSGGIGGAINHEGHSLHLIGCTFKNNYTTSTDEKCGGAIGYNFSKPSDWNTYTNTHIINCVFERNYYGNDLNKKSDLGLCVIPNEEECKIGGCSDITITPFSSSLKQYRYGSGVVDLDYSSGSIGSTYFSYRDFPCYTLVIKGGKNSERDGFIRPEGSKIVEEKSSTRYKDTSEPLGGGVQVGKAIETITFTAKEGCVFEDFANITKNGLTVIRISDKEVTVSGTPTDSVIITVPDAVAENSKTVTFKVVNGSWDDGSKADKTVTLTGYKEDTLKLKAGDIPAVGSKPNDSYKAGSWDETPSTETAITVDTIYKYTYVKKEKANITKEPSAKTLIYNGSEQELVIAGTAEGGTMQYALGDDDKNAPSSGYTISIPTKTEAGTYYVWYKVVGDKDHLDSTPACVVVTIGERRSKGPKTEDLKGKEHRTDNTEAERKNTIPAGSGGEGTLSQTPTEPAQTVPSDNGGESSKVDQTPTPEEPTPATTTQDPITGVTVTADTSAAGTTVVTSVAGNGGKTLRITGTVNQNGTNYVVSSFAAKSFRDVDSKNIVIDLKASGNAQTVELMPKTFEGSEAIKLTLKLTSSSQVKFSSGALSGSKIKKVVVSGLNKKEFKRVQKKLVKSGYKGKIVKK